MKSGVSIMYRSDGVGGIAGKFSKIKASIFIKDQIVNAVSDNDIFIAAAVGTDGKHPAFFDPVEAADKEPAVFMYLDGSALLRSGSSKMVFTSLVPASMRQTLPSYIMVK